MNIAALIFLLTLLAAALFGGRCAAEPAVEWSQLTASQLSELPPSVFTTITIEQLQSIPPQAFPGFKLEQLEAIPELVCDSAFTAAQLAQIPAATFAGFSPQCFAFVLNAHSAIISTEQFLGTRPDVFGELGDLISHVPDAVFAAMSPANASVLHQRSCGFIAASQFGALKPDSFAALSESCFGAIRPSAWILLSAEQMSRIGGNLVPYFTEVTVLYIPSAAFAGVQTDLITSMSTTICGSLSADQVANVPLARLGDFKADCLSACAACLAKLTADQVSAISPAGFVGAVNALTSLPGPSYAGITPAQLQSVCKSKNWDKFGAVSPDGANFLQNATIAKINEACFASINLPVLRSISPRFIANLDPNTVQSISEVVLPSINPMAFAGFSAQQFARLQIDQSVTYTRCSVISADQFGYLVPDAVAVMTPECFGQLKTDTFKGFTAAQMALLPTGLCKSISESIFALMTIDAISGFSGECVCSLAPSVFNNILPRRLAAFSPDGFSGFQSAFVEIIPPKSWSFIVPRQLARISPAALGGFHGRQVKYVSPPAWAGLTPSQMRGMQYGVNDTLVNLTPEQWFFIPPETMAALNCSSMFSGISINAWDRLQPAQFAALPPILFDFDCFTSYVWLGMASTNPAIFMHMSPAQISAATADMCMQLIPPAFVKISLASWANASMDCISGVVENSIRELTPDIFRTISHQARDYLTAYWGLPGRVLINMTDTELKQLGPVALTSIDASNTWLPRDFKGKYNENFARLMRIIEIGDQITISPPDTFNPTSLQLPSINVLQMAFYLKTSGPIRSFHGFVGPTLSGLQPALVPSITPEGMASLTAEHASWIQIPTFMAFSPQQITFLTPEAVSGFRVGLLAVMLPAHIQALSTEQLNAFNPLTFSKWNCVRLTALTDDQVLGLNDEATFMLDTLANTERCPGITKSFHQRATRNNPVGPPQERLKFPAAPVWVYGVLAIIAIAVVAAAAIAVIVYFQIRRRTVLEEGFVPSAPRNSISSDADESGRPLLDEKIDESR